MPTRCSRSPMRRGLPEDRRRARRRPGRPATSTLQVCAGRPFFIRIGVSQASEAPAASSAAITPGHSRGSRSSTLVSSSSGRRRSSSVPGGRAGRRPAAAARSRGPSGSRPPAPTPTRRTVIAGCGAVRRRRGVVSSAAPVGVHSSALARPGVRRDAAQQLGDRRRRHRQSRRARRGPCRSRPRPAETTSALERRGARARRRPRPRRRSRRGRRPRGSARRRAACRAPRLGDGEPLEDVAAPGRARRRRQRRPRRAGSRTSRQVRCVAESATSTWQPGGGEPVAGTRLGASSVDRLGGDRVDRGRQHVERHAGADQGAEQHVAAGAGRGVDPADHARGSRRGAGVAGHPGGEHAGAEPVVDVDHGDAGRAGVQHRQQRGQAAERGAVADAGRHRDERDAGRARRPRSGRAPSMPATTTRQSAAASSSRTASSRCSPATPTSLDRVDPGAVHPGGERGLGGDRRVGGAGATTATVPRGSGSGPSVDRAGDRVDDGVRQRRRAPRRAPRRRAGSRAPPGRGAASCSVREDLDDLLRASCRRRRRPRGRRCGARGRRRAARSRGRRCGRRQPRKASAG